MNLSELNFLVVEDNDFQRMMVVNLLKSLGAKSIGDAANGKLALEIIRTEKGLLVDLVICDISMPEMDGMEFLRHLGQLNHKASIILLSALGSKLLNSVAKMSKKYGVNLLGVLDKPINSEILDELLLNFVPFESNWGQANTAKNFTLEELLRGINDCQFEPFFQPKVDFKTGKIIGAEALAHWNHPELGIVCPNAFLPSLEKSGNLDKLTFLILEKSASACLLLHQKGFKLSISVNLTSNSLENSLMALKVFQVVQKVGLDPSYIMFEITGMATVRNITQCLENLERLCCNGFALSIDDYGAEFSNMQQLARIDFSEIKIDPSFINDFSGNDALRVMVKASIDKAHKLQTKSVAKGVETQTDWALLKDMDCDIAQGNFIAKPMNLMSLLKFCGEYPIK